MIVEAKLKARIEQIEYFPWIATFRSVYLDIDQVKLSWSRVCNILIK